MKSLTQFIESHNFLIKGHTKDQKDARKIYKYERDYNKYLYVMELTSNEEMKLLLDKVDGKDKEVMKYTSESYTKEHDDVGIVYIGFSNLSKERYFDCVMDKAIKKKKLKPIDEIPFNSWCLETWIKRGWVKK